MFRAVIFDMFETLITQFAGKPYFGREIAADLDIPESRFREIWDDETWETARTTGKITLEEELTAILHANGRDSEELLRAVAGRRIAAKRECLRRLHPEILPMLGSLKRTGAKLGLVSNCYSEEAAVLRESFLMPYFDAVCLSWEEGVMKPDREIFDRCVQRLGVPAGECLYVGDGGSRELEAAAALGMRPLQAVWYLRDGAGRDPRFTQVEKPMEVLRCL